MPKYKRERNSIMHCYPGPTLGEIMDANGSERKVMLTVYFITLIPKCCGFQNNMIWEGSILFCLDILVHRL